MWMGVVDIILMKMIGMGVDKRKPTLADETALDEASIMRESMKYGKQYIVTQPFSPTASPTTTSTPHHLTTTELDDDSLRTRGLLLVMFDVPMSNQPIIVEDQYYNSHNNFSKPHTTYLVLLIIILFSNFSLNLNLDYLFIYLHNWIC